MLLPVGPNHIGLHAAVDQVSNFPYRTRETVESLLFLLSDATLSGWTSNVIYFVVKRRSKKTNTDFVCDNIPVLNHAVVRVMKGTKEHPKMLIIRIFWLNPVVNR